MASGFLISISVIQCSTGSLAQHPVYVSLAWGSIVSIRGGFGT